MQDEFPKKSFKDRIKSYLHPVAKYSTVAIGAGVAGYYVRDHRSVLTVCHVSLESINKLCEQGQGVIEFGDGVRNKVWLALPDKV